MTPTTIVSKRGNALMKFVTIPRTKEYQDSLEPDSYVMPHRAKKDEVEFLKSKVADLESRIEELESNFEAKIEAIIKLI